MNAQRAAKLREAIMAEMGKLGRGATGPSTMLLASLTGYPLGEVTEVLRALEDQKMVTGRAVRTGGGMHWVPYGYDSRVL